MERRSPLESDRLLRPYVIDCFLLRPERRSGSSPASRIMLMTDVSTPGTPAGHVLAAWLDSFNSGDVARIREFHTLYCPDLDPSALEALADFRVESGGVTL